MTKAALIRTQRICDTEGTPRFIDGSVSFLDDHGVHIDIDSDTWRDMGEPNQITVTIEPGDTLTESRGDREAGHDALHKAIAAGTERRIAISHAIMADVADAKAKRESRKLRRRLARLLSGGSTKGAA